MDLDMQGTRVTKCNHMNSRYAKREIIIIIFDNGDSLAIAHNDEKTSNIAGINES